MKKTIILSAAFAAALCAVPANATVMFFSPDGAGEMDGSSWENAAPASALAEGLKALEAGDELYLRAGSYAPGLLEVPAGVTVKGGFGDEYSGTDCFIEYPSASETILSAGESNTSAAFIRMDYAGDSAENPLTLLAGLTIRDGHSTTTTYKGSALFASNANAEFAYIKFVENKTDKGGGVVVLNGSKVYLHDCIWRDNQGTNAGVALHIRQKGGGTTAGTAGSEITVDRCEFSDNTVKEPTNNSVARYGGAIALSDNGGIMYMANSTVTGSHISWAGAGARIGGGTTFYSVNNTWFDNTCNQGARYSGGVLSVGTGAKFFSMADIVVNREEGKDDSGTNSFAHIFLQAATTEFTSGGYNVWTNVTNNTATGTLADNDNVDKTHTVATVFGDNEYAAAGYSRVIAPVSSFRGVPVAAVKAKAAEWGFPEFVDLGVDQTGATRPELSVPGAYDDQSYVTTGIDAAAVAADFRVEALGAGRYAVRGAEGPAAVYDLGGRRVLSATVADGDVLDLAGLAGGVYILNVDGRSAKLAI